MTAPEDGGAGDRRFESGGEQADASGEDRREFTIERRENREERGGAPKRAPQEARYLRRMRKKREYQQSYRDARQGAPDKRRIAAALLEVILEIEGKQPKPAFDKLFDAVVRKMQPFYEPEVTRPLIRSLREAAYDKAEDEKSRQRR